MVAGRWESKLNLWCNRITGYMVRRISTNADMRRSTEYHVFMSRKDMVLGNILAICLSIKESKETADRHAKENGR